MWVEVALATVIAVTLLIKGLGTLIFRKRPTPSLMTPRTILVIDMLADIALAWYLWWLADSGYLAILAIIVTLGALLWCRLAWQYKAIGTPRTWASTPSLIAGVMLLLAVPSIMILALA
jgi:hypothetical protein